MRYTDDKVIPGELSRRDRVKDYFRGKMSTEKGTFGPNLKKGVAK